MNKGVFSGIRRNTRSSVEDGLNADESMFVPAEDDPLSVRTFLPTHKPPSSRYKDKTSATLQRRYSTDTLSSSPVISRLTLTGGPGSANKIIYANGLWAAAQGSAVLTSPDAITWTTRTTTFGTTIVRSVAYGNGLWVAAGDTGQLRTSTDAITWTTQTSNFGTSVIWDVEFGNGIFVAVGAGGAIRTSTDAVTWVTRTSNAVTPIYSVIYGNGVWVAAIDANSISDPRIRTSTDAITWTTRSLTFTAIGVVLRLRATRNGYLAVAPSGGSALSSDNGVTWTTGSALGGSNSITSFGSARGLTVFPAGSAAVQVSTNAVTFTTISTGVGINSFFAGGARDNECIVVNQSNHVYSFKPALYRETSSLSPSFNEWFLP